MYQRSLSARPEICGDASLIRETVKRMSGKSTSVVSNSISSSINAYPRVRAGKTVMFLSMSNHATHRGSYAILGLTFKTINQIFHTVVHFNLLALKSLDSWHFVGTKVSGQSSRRWKQLIVFFEIARLSIKTSLAAADSPWPQSTRPSLLPR